MNICYRVLKELDNQDIEDILDTALEGGIGYWACLLNDQPEYQETLRELEKEKAEGKIKEIYYSTVLIRMMEMGRPIKFEDAEAIEDADPEVWELNATKFTNGCELYEKNRGSIRKALDDGGFDAVEADCLIQYALFGEVVFG